MMFDHIFLRFIVVGVINTIVGGALIFLLYNIVEIGYWLSSMVSYVLISILSFILNKYFTFGIRYWSAFMIIAFVFTIMFS
jgi:putative flippase GtrA